MAGTITSLEVQEHNHERVNVYLDGTFGFGLAAIEAGRLRKGQTLSDAEIAHLKAHDAVHQAYERALRFLGARPRSATEIRRHLMTKKIPPSVIDEALARLQDSGYVDDLAFARFWVNNRQESKPHGARALRFELREKGIAPDVIDQVLEGLDTDDAAYRAAADKAKRLHGLDQRAFRDKLGSYLLRRGFDYGTARQVIDQLISERDDLNASADDFEAGGWDGGGEIDSIEE